MVIDRPRVGNLRETNTGVHRSVLDADSSARNINGIFAQTCSTEIRTGPTSTGC